MFFSDSCRNRMRRISPTLTMTGVWKVYPLLFLSACVFQQTLCQGSPGIYSSLQLDLFINYNREVSDFSKPLSINLAVRPIKLVNVDVENGLVVVDLWLISSWTDKRLRWDREYYNITELYIDPSRIFIPDIELYYGTTTNLLSNQKVVVNNNGSINLVQSLRAEIYCDVPSKPFRNTVCNMMFGSWTRDTDSVNLTTYTDAVDIAPVGKLTGVCRIRDAKARVQTRYYACCPNSYSSLMVALHIACYRSRATAASSIAQALGYRVDQEIGNNEENDFKKCPLPLVVAPFFVLLVFLLPHKANQRIFLGAFVFLYLLLIWTSDVLKAEYVSFHRLSVGVTVAATFASLLSCKMNTAGTSNYHHGVDDGIQPKDSWCKRRLASMTDMMMFAASAVVLGIATAGLLA
ncbi:acetylcholine receptor subunit alpha-type des-2-like isoform X2 [Apostichopus japonicus]|uniref:acetylcholine receptor subunit alpha-type des-2-like isoform X2 n=1 Tax=Stichopus japonicus TaxID=307972 RepID=UPI003AB204E5